MASKLKVTRIAFEQRYSDDSGVQFGVALGDRGIVFECVDRVVFPVEELDWLIACLQRIREELQ